MTREAVDALVFPKRGGASPGEAARAQAILGQATPGLTEQHNFSLSDPVNYHRPILMHQVRQRLPDGSDIGEYSCDPHAFYRGLQLDGRLEEYRGRSRDRL